MAAIAKICTSATPTTASCEYEDLDVRHMDMLTSRRMREIFQLLLTEKTINLRTNRRAGRGETRKPQFNQRSPIPYTCHASVTNAPSLPTSFTNIVAMDVSRQPSKHTEEPLMPAESANTEQQPDMRSTSGSVQLPLSGWPFEPPLTLPPPPFTGPNLPPGIEVEAAIPEDQSQVESQLSGVVLKPTPLEEKRMDRMDDVLNTARMYVNASSSSRSLTKDREVSLKNCYTCDRLFDRIDNIVPNSMSISLKIIENLDSSEVVSGPRLQIARGDNGQFRQMIRALVFGKPPQLIDSSAVVKSEAQRNQPQKVMLPVEPDGNHGIP